MRAFFFQVVKCSDTSNGVFETKFGDIPVSSEKQRFQYSPGIEVNANLHPQYRVRATNRLCQG